MGELSERELRRYMMARMDGNCFVAPMLQELRAVQEIRDAERRRADEFAQADVEGRKRPRGLDLLFPLPVPRPTK